MKTTAMPCHLDLAAAGRGGVEADPPRPKLSVTSEGVVHNQWGVKPPPTPPANRTLRTRINERRSDCSDKSNTNKRTHKLLWNWSETFFERTHDLLADDFNDVICLRVRYVLLKLWSKIISILH